MGRKASARLALTAWPVCLVLALFTPRLDGHPASERFDWMPPQIDEQGLNSQDLGGEQILPEITITEPPKLTADITKFTKEYVIELKKFNISNTGTNAVQTSKGLNQALQHAKTLGANRIVFPKGTYLISETDPVVIDHKDTIIDLNGATLQLNANGLSKYAIVEIVDGAENVRLTNGILRGDKDKHVFSTGRGHEWGHGIIFHGGRNLEVDHLKVTNVTGDGANTRTTGARTRPELLAKIAHSIYAKELEKGAFSDEGVKIDSTEKTRSINPYDITKCNGEFEFGYSTGYMGYPFIKGRVYQAYFYDAQMKFIEMKKCLQFRKVAVPEGAKFAHLEFNQPEVSDEPAHAGASRGSFIGRISNFKGSVDVHFHHNTLVGNRRLGMGYCGGRKWLIEENLFEGNGGTAPAYGIDFEDGWEFMQDVVFRNNRFKGNVAGDLVICAGSELLIEDNIFEKNVVVHGRPHNYIFRNNKYTGGNVGYKTRTGVAKIHDNTYENCTISIVFDNKAVADDLYRKPGETVATPPLTLENETLVNVSSITGTYFNFKNTKLTNARLVAGDQTRMVNLKNCEFDGVSLEYMADSPEVHVKIEDCKGELEQKGPGLNRRKLHP